MLENVTFTMKNPSIIDIKIGSKTWTPGDCKLKKLQEKICHPAAKDIGFRITGGKSFDIVTNSYKAIKFWEIRSFSKTELVEEGRFYAMVVLQLKLLFQYSNRFSPMKLAS